jgi:hypothetical protein
MCLSSHTRGDFRPPCVGVAHPLVAFRRPSRRVQAAVDEDLALATHRPGSTPIPRHVGHGPLFWLIAREARKRLVAPRPAGSRQAGGTSNNAGHGEPMMLTVSSHAVNRTKRVWGLRRTKSSAGRGEGVQAVAEVARSRSHQTLAAPRASSQILANSTTAARLWPSLPNSCSLLVPGVGPG